MIILLTAEIRSWFRCNSFQACCSNFKKARRFWFTETVRTLCFKPPISRGPWALIRTLHPPLSLSRSAGTSTDYSREEIVYCGCRPSLSSEEALEGLITEDGEPGTIQGTRGGPQAGSGPKCTSKANP